MQKKTMQIVGDVIVCSIFISKAGQRFDRNSSQFEYSITNGNYKVRGWIKQVDETEFE